MRHTMIAVATFAAGVLIAASGVSAARAQPQPSPGAEVSRTESLSGSVESVNLVSREVVLHDEGGRLMTVFAGPEARNLEALRPGDRVAVELREALVVGLVRPGDSSPSLEILAEGVRAPAGERPGGALGQLVRVRVRIDAVDPEAGRVTFTGPAGGTRTVTARDPRMREFVRNFRPGEQVDIAYSEALAVRVEPAR